MPVFEFACAKCDHRFEELIRGDHMPTACPACQHQKVEKRLSTFAVGKEATRRYPAPIAPPCGGGGCGGLGPGACARN